MDAPDYGFDPVDRLTREMRQTVTALDRSEAGHLVDIYYRWQEHRIALGNQVNSLDKAGKPVGVLGHFYRQLLLLERQAASTLGEWAQSRPEGAWALDQVGIGPVLAAALSAAIDVHRANTCGAVWRYAGLDGSLVWVSRKDAQARIGSFAPVNCEVEVDAAVFVCDNDEVALKIETLAESTGRRGWKLALAAQTEDGTITPTSLAAALSRRPYNADLKVTCWKIGDSFCKVSGRPGAYYGHVYRGRKIQEVARNNQRAFANQATKSLETRSIRDPKLRKTYEDGKLPDGRLELRARRYAVKLFLSHWWEVARKAEGLPVPVPYPIAHLGHKDRIDPPPGG
jgi:hypothetical protein